jgi:hypothetical protein
MFRSNVQRSCTTPTITSRSLACPRREKQQVRTHVHRYWQGGINQFAWCSQGVGHFDKNWTLFRNKNIERNLTRTRAQILNGPCAVRLAMNIHVGKIKGRRRKNRSDIGSLGTVQWRNKREGETLIEPQNGPGVHSASYHIVWSWFSNDLDSWGYEPFSVIRTLGISYAFNFSTSLASPLIRIRMKLLLVTSYARPWDARWRNVAQPNHTIKKNL